MTIVRAANPASDWSPQAAGTRPDGRAARRVVKARLGPRVDCPAGKDPTRRQERRGWAQGPSREGLAIVAGKPRRPPTRPRYSR
jgi:hypothetical protein